MKSITPRGVIFDAMSRVPRTWDTMYKVFEASSMAWLYGEYDKEKLRQFEALHNVPVVSNYMDYLLDVRADEEYLRRYGMDYSDIHDPRKLKQVRSGSALYGSALNWVGKNIGRLYR